MLILHIIPGPLSEISWKIIYSEVQVSFFKHDNMVEPKVQFSAALSYLIIRVGIYTFRIYRAEVELLK